MKIKQLVDSVPKDVADRGSKGSVRSADSGRPTAKAATAASTASTNSVNPPASVEKIELSEASKALGEVDKEAFDPAKVAEIRKAMREGRFQIKAEVVADRMIRDSAELIVRIFGADPKSAQ